MQDKEVFKKGAYREKHCGSHKISVRGHSTWVGLSTSIFIQLKANPWHFKNTFRIPAIKNNPIYNRIIKTECTDVLPPPGLKVARKNISQMGNSIWTIFTANVPLLHFRLVFYGFLVIAEREEKENLLLKFTIA